MEKLAKVAGGFVEDLFRRFRGVMSAHDGCERCHGSNIQRTGFPCPRRFENAAQLQRSGDFCKEFRVLSCVIRAERVSDSLPANPESAALVAEHRSPAAGADHGSVALPCERDGSSARNKKNSRRGAD